LFILIVNNESYIDREVNMKPITDNEIRMAGERAAEYLGNGFHCAEAVATAALEAFDEDPSQAAAHATAFGGGFGRTQQESCGALSGALIAIGHLHGRRRPGGAWDLPAKFGAKMREHFLEQNGTTQCAALCARFGEKRQLAECRRLTQRVTSALLALLTAEAGIRE
jgi:C_GCAxxG_C_C family probable redox protein